MILRRLTRPCYGGPGRMAEQGLFAKGSVAKGTAGPKAGGPEAPEKSRAGAAYQVPVLGMDAQGSCTGLGSPRCKSSIEMLSGVLTKAI